VYRFCSKIYTQEYAGVATSFGSKAFKNAKYIAKENSEIVNRWVKIGRGYFWFNQFARVWH
jgi:amidase